MSEQEQQSPETTLKLSTPKLFAAAVGLVAAVSLPPAGGTWVLATKLDAVQESVQQNTTASQANTRAVSGLQTAVAVLASEGKQVEEIKKALESHKNELGHLHGVVPLVDRLADDLKDLKEDLNRHIGAPGHTIMMDRISDIGEKLRLLDERIRHLENR